MQPLLLPVSVQRPLGVAALLVLLLAMPGSAAPTPTPRSAMAAAAGKQPEPAPADTPEEPAESSNADADADADTDAEPNAAARTITGTAPCTPLGGGEPADKDLAVHWRLYADAPARINRDDGEAGGNGEPFEWQLTWDEEPVGRVRVGDLRFPSPVAYGTEANRTVHAAVYMPQAAAEPAAAEADSPGGNAPADAATAGAGAGAGSDSTSEHDREGDDAAAPSEPERRPAVVLLHHLLDDQRAERLVARYFASRGYVAVLLFLPHYGPRATQGRPDDQEMMRALIGEDFPKVAQGIWDVHRVRDWLKAQPYVDDNNLTLIGISLGGLLASLSAGVDPGFDRYVFVIAGGDIAHIIFNGSRETQWLLEQVRENGLTEDDLRRRVRPIDPCTFASRIDGRRVLMFNTEEDEVIPRAATEALIEAIDGEPTVHWYPGGHTAIGARFFDLLTRCTTFLARPLPPREPGDEQG